MLPRSATAAQAPHEGPAHLPHEDHGRIDIAEKRLPQDGRIKLTVDKPRSTSASAPFPPTRRVVVLRFLRPTASARIGIQNLASTTTDYKRFQKIIKRPNGIFLVTGPDRLGQDDDALRRAQRAQPPRPQDHHRRGPGRIQLRRHQPVPGAGQHRADVPRILRAMLRQAPNIILVGEIRDRQGRHHRRRHRSGEGVGGRQQE